MSGEAGCLPNDRTFRKGEDRLTIIPAVRLAVWRGNAALGQRLTQRKGAGFYLQSQIELTC